MQDNKWNMSYKDVQNNNKKKTAVSCTVRYEGERQTGLFMFFFLNLCVIFKERQLAFRVR